MLKYLMRKFALTEQGAKDFIKTLLMNVLSNIALMIPVWLLYILVDDLLGAGIPASHYYLFIFGSLGIIAALALIYYFQYHCSYFLTYKESGKRRIALAERLRKLPLSFFSHKDLTDMTHVIMNDATAIEQSFSHFMPNFYGSMISTVIIMIPIFITDWRMGFASLWVVPVSILIVFASRKAQNYFNRKKDKADLELQNNVQECIETIKDLKATNSEKEYMKKIKTNVRLVEKFHIQSELGVALFVVTAQMILKFGIATTALVGSILLIGGSLDMMVFFMFLLLVSRFYEPMATALQNLAAINSTFLNIERMNEFYNCPIQSGKDDFKPNNYDITFENVKFGYDKDESVINGVSFIVKQGEVTALVGPSGCGKSTISKLCSRFWDVDSGAIKLDGEVIKNIDPECLLKNYSIVFQDVNLFNNTIMENIRIGRKDATNEEVIEAARKANCDEFVSRLPDGYGTYIGENGAELSGGERQRISIARALLKDAPIVLLDEATASLDAENETIVQEAISNATKGKTVIVIAHRMRTIENADKVIVLNEGKVVEEGNPQELIKKNGEFAKMVSLQKESANFNI